MQALHYKDDAASLFVVEPAVKCVVVPGVDCIPLRLRQCFVRLQRVIDDDEIGATAGQYTAD
jgi:hypothetical protein